MFDVQALTDVGVNTFVQLQNISVHHGNSYTAYLAAVDELGTCAMIGANFTVDVTQPTIGRLGVGPDLDLVCLVIMCSYFGLKSLRYQICIKVTEPSSHQPNLLQ